MREEEAKAERVEVLMEHEDRKHDLVSFSSQEVRASGQF